MASPQIRRKLKSFAGLERFVCIERNYPGSREDCGFIIGVSNELMLFHPFHDFYPEGYNVLRLADVETVTRGDRECLWEKILMDEGMIDHMACPPEVPLSDIPSLLCTLQNWGRNIIVQCESRRSAEESDFCVGRIISLDTVNVVLRGFDPVGRWHKELSVIPYQVVTKIQFDTPYINIFSNYLDRTGQAE